MTRKYQDLWSRICRNETVTITCPRAGEKVVRAAIYNEKYYWNKKRAAMDLPGFGRINVVSSPVENKPTLIRLTIDIPYSGDNI